MLQCDKIFYSWGESRYRDVTLIIDNKISNIVKGQWGISNIVLLVKLYGKPINIEHCTGLAATTNSSEKIQRNLMIT